MSEAARSLMRLIHEMYEVGGPFEEYVKRPLICTPVKANYDTISAWVVSVRGSPPKGTLYISIESKDAPESVRFLTAQKSKLVSAEQNLQTIKQFYDQHLLGQEDTLTVSATNG